MMKNGQTLVNLEDILQRPETLLESPEWDKNKSQFTLKELILLLLHTILTRGKGRTQTQTHDD